MSNSNNDLFAAIGIIGGAAAMLFFANHTANLNQTARKLDMTIDELARRQPVDIQSAIVNKAVEKAVDRKVADSVCKIQSRIQQEMEDKIRREVSAKYKSIAEGAASRIAKEIDSYDIRDLKKQIREDAKKLISEKLENDIDEAVSDAKERFDEKFDDFIDNYTDKLDGAKLIFAKLS